MCFYTQKYSVLAGQYMSNVSTNNDYNWIFWKICNQTIEYTFDLLEIQNYICFFYNYFLLALFLGTLPQKM